MVNNGKKRQGLRPAVFLYVLWVEELNEVQTMARITITLSEEEKMALRSLSEKEFRDPRQQAALIIRRELVSQGLVASASTITGNKPSKANKAKIRQEN